MDPSTLKLFLDHSLSGLLIVAAVVYILPAWRKEVQALQTEIGNLALKLEEAIKDQTERLEIALKERKRTPTIPIEVPRELSKPHRGKS